MDLVIPDGFGLVTYHHESAAYDGEAIFSFGIDLNAVIPDDALAETFFDTWNGPFEGAYTNDIAQTKVRILYRLAGVLQSAEHVGFEPGGQSGQAAPPNCAALVSKKTSLVGRKFRGRAYLPNGPENEILLSSSWSVSFLGKVQLGVDAIADGYDTLGMTAVILHTDATPPTPISSLVARSRLATQRGRLRD